MNFLFKGASVKEAIFGVLLGFVCSTPQELADSRDLVGDELDGLTLRHFDLVKPLAAKTLCVYVLDRRKCLDNIHT